MPDLLADQFLRAALRPQGIDHASGSLDQAQALLQAHPELRTANIYTAAALGEADRIRTLIESDPPLATAPGGPYGWDALTHLCFSRYLRLDLTREAGFVATARILLAARTNPNTGWYEAPQPGQQQGTFESVLYGASSVARNLKLTRLLLEAGADPNDGETPYHVPESYDNAILQLLLESGKLSPQSLVWILVRKADIHDRAGMRLALEHGAAPNALPMWGYTALQQAIRRDNRVEMIALLLDHGADPHILGARDQLSGVAIAARRARHDLLTLFAQRGIPLQLEGFDLLAAHCARGDEPSARELLAADPTLVPALQAEGGALLAQAAITGNTAAIRGLLALGVPVYAPYDEPDGYLNLGQRTTALHAAAWRIWPETVRELLAHGAPVNVRDAAGRTPLHLAVRACADSWWTERRSPDCVEILLTAGAHLDGVQIPSGYAPVDDLLAAASASSQA